MFTIYKLLNLFNVSTHTSSRESTESNHLIQPTNQLFLNFIESSLSIDLFKSIELKSIKTSCNSLSIKNRSISTNSSSCSSFHSIISLSIQSLPNQANQSNQFDKPLDQLSPMSKKMRSRSLSSLMKGLNIRRSLRNLFSLSSNSKNRTNLDDDSMRSYERKSNLDDSPISEPNKMIAQKSNELDEDKSIHTGNTNEIYNVPMSAIHRPLPSELDERKVHSLMASMRVR